MYGIVWRGPVQTATPRFKARRLFRTVTPLWFKRACPAPRFKLPRHTVGLIPRATPRFSPPRSVKRPRRYHSNNHAPRPGSNGHGVWQCPVQMATPRSKARRPVQTATPLRCKRACPAPRLKSPRHTARPGSNGHTSVQPATPSSHGHAAINANHHASRPDSHGHDVWRGTRSRRVARPGSDGHASFQPASPASNGHAATVQMRTPRVLF